MNDCSIDENQSSEKHGIKFPLVAILASVAGVIALLAIFTICVIFKREKQGSGEGINIRLGLKH